AARDELQRIADDAPGFLAGLVDLDPVGRMLTLVDGTRVPRLPGYRRWMWDGEFCGSIGLRWQPGTEALPPYCLGHLRHGGVAGKRGRGYATSALREVLVDARERGLRWVDLTTTPDNLASRRVIEANGGVFVEEFTTPASVGGQRDCRYRVHFDFQRG